MSRYFSAIGKVWLEATAEQAIDEWGVNDYDELYESILELAGTEKTRHYNAKLLSDLHRHGVGLLGFPPAVTITGAEQGSLMSRVRSGMISECLYKAVVASIAQIGDLVEHERHAVESLVGICFRAGLRLGEVLKLRLCDIEDSSDNWLLIRNNRYGNNKSLSSMRKIPLALLLTPHEVQRFKDYHARQRAIAKTNPSALLFSQAHSPLLPLDNQHISQMIGYLLSTISGQKWVFHHLRHSALTRLFYVLDDAQHKIAIETGYDPKQIDNIRRFFLKARGEVVNHDNDLTGNHVNKDVYWAIAGLAGHATPATTWSTYIHLADWAVGCSLGQSKARYSIPVIKAITGWSHHRIRTIYRQQASLQEPLPIRSAESCIMAQASTYVVKPKIKVPTPTAISAGSMPRAKFGIDFCHDVLRAIEGGDSVVGVAKQFAIDPESVQRWVDNAVMLSELITRVGAKQLIAAGRKTVPAGKILVPPRPRAMDERRQADKALTNLRLLYKSHKQEIVWCVKYYVTRTNTSKYGIPFNHKEELYRFVKLMIQLDKSSNWVLRMLGPVDRKSESMITELQEMGLSKSNIFVDKERYLKSRYRLYWRTPKSRVNDQSSVYSSSAPRYLFYMLAITLADEIGLEAMAV